MKFERLRASIVNNAQEEPSVYMAVCAIESLLRDMEDESGRPVDQLPAGDEMLSAKLIWLCRTVRSIYTGRSEDLQRNRGRLDRAMDELRQAEGALGDLAREEQRLAALQTQLASLEQQLASQRDTHAACVSLQEQIASLERELDRLRALDPDKLQGELDRLCSQTELLRGEQQELEDRLESEQKALDDLRHGCDAASLRIDACRREKEDSSRALVSLQTEQEQAETLLRQQKDQIRELEQQKQALQQQREESLAQLQELRSALSAYQDRELDPLLRELDEAKIEKAKHEEEKAQILEQSQMHRQQRDRLVLEIASVKQQCEEAEAAARDKDEERTRAEARCRLAREKQQELQQKLDSLRDELSSLQDQVSRLEQEELPRQQQFTADEQERRDRLQAQWNEAKAKADQLRTENQRLAQELQELEKDCQISQASYDTLSADCAGKREELQVLGDKIRELEGKTEVQRYEVLKRQQEERLRDLNQICGACRKLEEELPEVEKQLEGEQQKFRELTARRDQMAKTKQEITTRVEELKKFATAEFETKLSGSQRRLALLNEGREQLRGALDLVRQATGAQALDAENQDLLRQTGQGVRQLQEAVLSLQKALVNCADLASWERDH